MRRCGRLEHFQAFNPEKRAQTLELRARTRAFIGSQWNRNPRPQLEPQITSLGKHERLNQILLQTPVYKSLGFGSGGSAAARRPRVRRLTPASRRGRDKRGFHRRATFPCMHLPYFVLSALVLSHVAMRCHILQHVDTFCLHFPIKVHQGEMWPFCVIHIYIYTHVYTYISLSLYIYIYISISISLSLYLYIYIYMYTYAST